MIRRLSACAAHTKGTAVMVRAVNDEPVALIAIAVAAIVVDVVAEDPEKRASIGVPQRRVFAHDDRLFRELRASFDEGRLDILGALWAGATLADLSHLPARTPATESRTHPS
jgi:hypothetical protein